MSEMKPTIISGLRSFDIPGGFSSIDRSSDGSSWGKETFLEWAFTSGCVFLYEDGTLEFAGDKEVLSRLVFDYKLGDLFCAWVKDRALLEVERSLLEKVLLQFVSPVLGKAFSCCR